MFSRALRDVPPTVVPQSSSSELPACETESKQVNTDTVSKQELQGDYVVSFAQQLTMNFVDITDLHSVRSPSSARNYAIDFTW